MFNSELQNFNLYEQQPEKKDVGTEEILPKLSIYDYYVLDFIKTLKKAPPVKRELNKNWALDRGGGGDSIFDDFFGGSSS